MSKSLSHQVGILTLGRVFAYAVMFFVPIVNVRALSVEHYGYYRQFWLLFETLGPLLILGFPRSLLYYLPRTDSDREKSVYITQTVTFLFVMSLIAVCVYFVMGQVLGSGMGALVRAFFWRLSFFTVCMMVSDYMDSLFVAEKQVKRQAIYHAVSSSIQAVVVIIVSWYTRSIVSLIWALAIMSGLKVSFALLYTAEVYKPALRLMSLSSIREQLSFALPLGMRAIAFLLLAQTDKFIINRLLGREAFAVYSIGAFQLPFVNILAASVSSVTLPLMARYQKDGEFDEVSRLWKRSTLKLALLFCPIFVFFLVTAGKFITIFFTDDYAEAIPVFEIYLLLFLRSTIDIGSIMTVFKQNIYMFKVLAVAVVVNVILSYVLFSQIGRLGVPISTVIIFFVVTVVVVKKSASLLKQSFFDVLPWAGIWYRLVVAAVPGVALYFGYARVAGNSIWLFVLAAAGYFMAYFVICRALRLMTLGDIKSLLGRSE